MIREQERRKYSIRKYSIGVVSVLAATVFVVSTHDAKAAEKCRHHCQGHNKKN